MLRTLDGLIWVLLAASAGEGEEVPGLLGEYRSQLGEVTRVDESLAFDWQEDRPDARLADGPFDVTWRGLLFVPQAGRHRLSLFVQGMFSFQLDGKEILGGELPTPQWQVSAPMDLSFGSHPVEIRYRRQEGMGLIKAYWQNDSFDREPIPATRWFHQAKPVEPIVDMAERVAAARCAACHDLPELPIAARDLSKRTMTPEEIAKALSPNRANGHPIHWGWSAQETRLVAQTLWESQEEIRLEPAKPGDADNGQKTFESVGCLACHRVDGVGSNRPLSGGDLSSVGTKRSVDFLFYWLKSSTEIHPDRRMPAVDLSPEEVADLTAYLSGLRAEEKEDETAKPAVDVETIPGDPRGLLGSANCQACHTMPGSPAPLPRTALGPGKGCVGEADRSRHRPGYGWSAAEGEQMLAYVRGVRQGGRVSADQVGAMTLARNNCLGCHARGTGAGLREVLTELGTSDAREQAVRSAPPLHSVGDKLHEEWLARAVTGTAPRLRPWLTPRMPRFHVGESDRRDLVRMLVSQDRMPASDDLLTEPPQNEAEELLAAQRLVGPAGFGCMSCHQVGKHVPVGGEPSARGPDLAGIGSRMREEWFHRWTKNPARIAGGVEMPAITLARPGLLDDRLDFQLRALWRGLNSPSFRTPLLEAVQSLSAIGKSRPLILRDLVELEPKKTLSRPFAVGLTHGHSVLFDLDRMKLVQWWMGDFAQEQTRGKSWYWTTAGTMLWNSPSPPLLALDSDGEWKMEGNDRRHPLKLVGWTTKPDHVSMELALDGDREGDRIKIRVAPVEGGVRIVIGSASGEPAPRYVVIPPVTDAWMNSAGRGLVEIQGGEACEGSISGERPPGARRPGRRLTSDVTIVLRLEKPVQPVTAFHDLPRLPVAGKDLAPIPGYRVRRLGVDDGPMPTALAPKEDGSLLVASLKGGVFHLVDSNGDGDLDTYRPMLGELAAPFGLLAESSGLLVAHKHELLRVRQVDEQGQAEQVEVVASGWGVTPDYHDWIVGPVAAGDGTYYLAASCQQDKRPVTAAVGRGKLLRTNSKGGFEIVAEGLRFPMGLVANGQGDLFASDNQGVTNPFNEINHLRPGKHYGFFNALEKRRPAGDVEPAAVEIPHPWTGSVNGLSFIPSGSAFGPFGGQLIGAEYTTRRLIRVSFQKVGETFQGCVYPFGEVDQERARRDETFLGPISLAFAPDGSLYVGSMIDSGWGGGNNRGAIERVQWTGSVPFGIREVRAWREGFDIDFTHPADAARGGIAESYRVSSYQRVPKGGYATPDSDRQSLAISRAELSGDRRSVRLWVKPLRVGYVHEVSIEPIRGPEKGSKEGELIYPATAYFTFRGIPEDS